MKRLLILLAGLCLLGAGTAGAVVSNPWSPYPILRPFKVKVWGKCHAGRGKVNIQVKGMTPMGTFHWREWYPNGKEISFSPYFTNGYTLAVTPRSGVIRLDEDCSTDRLGGRYKLAAWDETTPYRAPAIIHFTVGPPQQNAAGYERPAGKGARW